MCNGRTHKLIGIAAGATTAIAANHSIFQDSENAWLYMIGGAVGGWACSTIPDLLEPSKELGPNHRGFCHGIIPNAVGAGFLGLLWQKANQLVENARVFDSEGEKCKAALCRLAVSAMIGGAAGYTSHLLTDSTTTKGLPFFC
ncbi:MAG: metal-dependent hydrolase [Planctomycetaceae bacterium]|nr:metal-dependent hydrolase [Planctomycetaceae bacterium]